MSFHRTSFGRGVLLTSAIVCAAVSARAASSALQLTPPDVPSGIVINVPQRMLFLVSGGKVVARYPVGLGRRDWPTFVGAFTITSKEIDPVWEVPVSIQEEQRRAGKPVLTRVPPGPDNPLGKYWIGLSVPGYGIHGTNAPASISKFQTHGCIRLRSHDIEDLFSRVEVGTPGVAVYEPLIVAIVDGALWMEAHPDVYRRDQRDALAVVADAAARIGWAGEIDWEQVQRVLRARAGQPHRVSPEPDR